MRITLIKPNMGKMMTGVYIDEGRMEPLQLGVLAALTPEDVEIKMYDDRMEEIPFDEETDLVAITVESFTAKRSYEISSEYRKRGVKVVMGGMHPSLIPDESQLYCDSLVIGDAESVWEDVVNDAREGKLKSRYTGIFGNVQKRKKTRRDIFKNKGYLPFSLIQFGRGCRYGCEFCASSRYFNKGHYCREIDDVIKEISEDRLKLIFFVDDNIISDREKAKELFRRLIPLKIRWFSQASLDMVEDLELMKLMKESGCLGNVVGFESINEENLRQVSKEQNCKNFDYYKREIAIMKDYNLQNWAAFTLGYDFDTVDSIKRTTEFAIKNKFAFAAFNILMPYPDTAFYKLLERENRVLYNGKWWLHDDYRFNHASFIPKKMSPEQLTEAAFEARKEFNSLKSVVYRSFDIKTHMSSIFRYLAYFQYNPLFKKEMYKKQGLKLGEK